MLEVGLRIKEVRESKKISQEKLAKKLSNLNQSQLCKIESNKRSLKVDELIEISKVLNEPIEKILEGC